jgi:hypothetical protein
MQTLLYIYIYKQKQDEIDFFILGSSCFQFQT